MYVQAALLPATMLSVPCASCLVQAALLPAACLTSLPLYSVLYTFSHVGTELVMARAAPS